MAAASNFQSSSSAHGQPAADAPDAGAAGVAGGIRGDWLVRVLCALSAGTAVPQLLPPRALRPALGIGDGARPRAGTAVGRGGQGAAAGWPPRGARPGWPL